jgi:hypothetical protein
VKRAHNRELHRLEVLEVPLSALDAQGFNRSQEVELYRAADAGLLRFGNEAALL